MVGPSTEDNHNTLTDRFVLGANFPWVSNGHDFGPRPLNWGAESHDWTRVSADIEGLKRDQKVSVIRWFILAAGVNYPVHDDITLYGRWMIETPEGRFDQVQNIPESLRNSVSIQLEPNSLALRPLPGGFIDDFRELLSACRDNDVMLLPSLMSFEWFQARTMKNKGVTSGGRKHLVIGREDEFLDTVLEPLLEVSKDFRSSIYAWEVINEPDWVTIGGPMHAKRKTVTANEMSHLISNATLRIYRAGFRSTVGFVQHDPSWLPADLVQGLRTMASADNYIHQFHYYRSRLMSDPIPPHDSVMIKPCIVGEFQTRMGYEWDENVEGLKWVNDGAAEDEPDGYLYARLGVLDRVLEYPAVFFWGKNSRDSFTTWRDSQKIQIMRYMQGRPP